MRRSESRHRGVPAAAVAARGTKRETRAAPVAAAAGRVTGGAPARAAATDAGETGPENGAGPATGSETGPGISEGTGRGAGAVTGGTGAETGGDQDHVTTKTRKSSVTLPLNTSTITMLLILESRPGWTSNLVQLSWQEFVSTQIRHRSFPIFCLRYQVL